MTAAPENAYAMKFKTPEERQDLCDSYIEHVESGLSDECFPDCDPQTLRRYLGDFPDDFDTDAMEKAKRKRQLYWEKAGRDGMMGHIDGFNANSWKFNMQNRFSWKEKREETVVPKDAAADLMNKMFDKATGQVDTAADVPTGSPDPLSAASDAGTGSNAVPPVLSGRVPDDSVSVPATGSQSDAQQPNR
jgi:uncharacterized protein (DUF2249 family)